MANVWERFKRRFLLFSPRPITWRPISADPLLRNRFKWRAPRFLDKRIWYPLRPPVNQDLYERLWQKIRQRLFNLNF